MAAQRKTFYRRVLPSVCTAFASKKGKQLFMDALPTKHMDCYFSLASQFRTQEEPAYCGLSSLVMVLNALAVDPGVVWKGVFRWYHEDMLDCCTPLEEVREKGVTIEKLLCLAICNQLEGRMKRIDDTACIQKFREEIKDVTSCENKAMIISYGRNVLGQTGTGHFSPVGGYNEMEDMVLIFDVARFKYPPYWLPLDKLWEAMKSPDTETGLPRGYMTVWRADDGATVHPPLLFKVSKQLNVFHPVFEQAEKFLKKIKDFLNEPVEEESEDDILCTIIKRLLQDSYSLLIDENNAESQNFLSLRVTESQLESLTPKQADAIQQLVQAITETTLFSKILKLIPPDRCCNQGLFNVGTESDHTHSCKNSTKLKLGEEDCTICLPHFMTVFLLSFPLEDLRCCSSNHCKGMKQASSTGTSSKCGCSDPKATDTYSSFIKTINSDHYMSTYGCSSSSHTDKERNELLVNEVTQLRRQFVALLTNV